MARGDDRPQMEVDEFERIANAAEREGVTLEFIQGKLGVKAAPDGDHTEIVRWVMERCRQQRPELWLYPRRGLSVGSDRDDRARTDGALAPEGSFSGQCEWADPGQVLMVLEVTTNDIYTDELSREKKPRSYAEAGIPIYLLIDRNVDETFVYSKPEGGQYTTLVRRPFWKLLALPHPADIAFESERLMDWPATS